MEVIGHLCVPTNAQDSLSAGEKSLKSFMRSMRQKAKERKQSKLNNYGTKLSTHKLKQAHHTWSTKIRATENQTNKILERLRAQTSVLRLSSTQALMKLQFAILLRFLSLVLPIQRIRVIIMKSCIK